MKVCYPLDENLSPRLISALKRLDSSIDVLRVSDEGAPSLGTPDRLIIRYLGTHKRLFVTDNRATIPGHLIEHFEEGGESHWGILWVQPDASIGQQAANG